MTVDSHRTGGSTRNTIGRTEWLSSSSPGIHDAEDDDLARLTPVHNRMVREMQFTCVLQDVLDIPVGFRHDDELNI